LTVVRVEKKRKRKDTRNKRKETREKKQEKRNKRKETREKVCSLSNTVYVGENMF